MGSAEGEGRRAGGNPGLQGIACPRLVSLGRAWRRKEASCGVHEVQGVEGRRRGG